MADPRASLSMLLGVAALPIALVALVALIVIARRRRRRTRLDERSARQLQRSADRAENHRRWFEERRGER